MSLNKIIRYDTQKGWNWKIETYKIIFLLSFFPLILDSGTCIALHPVDQSLFLIGTEEGFIYKCSTAYLSMYLFTYAAHQMPVHRLDFNKYSPNIFASCSADWSIKVWEDNRKYKNYYWFEKFSYSIQLHFSSRLINYNDLSLRI